MASTKTPGPISVFGWGLGGVNLVKDPLMLDDNELLVAQNIEPYRDQGVAGVRKRPGLQAVVPTGSVTPSPSSGGIVATYTIDPDPSTNSDPRTGGVEVLLGSGAAFVSADGGTTFNSRTVTGLGDDTLLPNAKYTFPGGGYEFVPCFGGVRVPYGDRPGTAFIIGGHAAGQILVTRTIAPATASAGAQTSTRGVTIFSAGSADDTFVLDGVWHRPFGDTKNYAIVINTSGACALYAPANDEVITLPSFTGSGLATGSPGLVNGRLWVANSKYISSIDPLTGSAWVDTDAASAISDAGVTQLTGLAEYNGILYAGTKQTSAGSVPYVLKAVLNADGTCTVTKSIQGPTGSAPAYFFGPSPRVADGRPIYATMQTGFNGTLAGTDAGAADSLSTRCIVGFTPAAKWRLKSDVQNAANGFHGSSSRNLGPYTVVASTQSVYWIGSVVDGGTQYLVLGVDLGGAGNITLNRQTNPTNLTYPLYIP